MNQPDYVKIIAEDDETLRRMRLKAIEWRTVIVGLPTIRKLLNGEDVELETFRINLIPDDVLFNAKPRPAPPVAPGEQPSPIFVTQAPWGSAPAVLHTGTRVQMQEIGPDAFITNSSEKVVVLDGTLIRRLIVPAGKTVRVVSPVLEHVVDYTTKETKLQEWDAMKVAENMVNEFARGVAYDELTPQECREVTFPVPDRMLGRILDRIGLRVHY